MTDLTLTLPLTEWDNLVSRVAPFAESASVGIPLLASVRLYEADGRLYAQATDRYRIAIAVARGDAPIPKGLDIVIATSSLANLARISKAPARLRKSLAIRLELAASGSSVKVSLEALPGLGDVIVDVPLVGGDYPPISRIVHGALADESAPASSVFDPRLLVDFCKVAGPGEGVSITTHGNKPALVRVGDSLVGALIPRRYSNDGPEFADDVWAHLAPAAEEAAA